MRLLSILVFAICFLSTINKPLDLDDPSVIIDYLMFRGLELRHELKDVGRQCIINYEKAWFQMVDAQNREKLAGICQKLKVILETNPSNHLLAIRLDACQDLLPSFETTIPGNEVAQQAHELQLYVTLSDFGLSVLKRSAKKLQKYKIMLGTITDYIYQIDLDTVKGIVGLCDGIFSAPNWPSFIACLRLKQIYRPDKKTNKLYPSATMDDLLDDLAGKVDDGKLYPGDRLTGVRLIIQDYIQKILLERMKLEELISECQARVGVTMNTSRVPAHYRACQMILEFISRADG